MPAQDINWKRRATTSSIWLTLAVVLPLLVPVVVPFTAVWDVITRRKLSTSRTFVFFAQFFFIESVGVVGAGVLWLRRAITGQPQYDYEISNRRLQYWWGRNLFWQCVKTFGVDVTIDGLEVLEDPKPCLVLARHASTLDTMLPIAVVRQMKHYRYVIKAELLTDPAMDFVAQRFPNVFVHRGSKDPAAEVDRVEALGRDLEPKGAVVVYPEGTRFTPKKRAHLLEKFERNGDPLLPIAKKLTHTLPPLREGAVRLVETMKDADVVVVAHRGIDQAGAMSDLVKGLLTHAKMEIVMWRIPAEEVPREPEEAREFMVRQWERVNAYAAGEAIDFEEAASGAVETPLPAASVSSSTELDRRADLG